MLTLTSAIIALLAGGLSGLTGLGGVLLVPALTELGRIPIDRAVAAAMASFMIGGAVAAAMHLRNSAIGVRLAGPVCVAASLGAIMGAASIRFLPPSVLRLIIAMVALVAGAQALIAPNPASRERTPSAATLGGLGLLVGFGSSITGTGGPTLLVPTMLTMRAPVRLAVGLALAIQVPIALSATLINVAADLIDWRLATSLSVLVLGGAALGSLASRRLSRERVTTVVAITLIAVGIWYGAATVGSAPIHFAS